MPTPTPTTLSGVHHLGDQTLSDWEVPKPEGTEYTTTFSLTAVPASADLILDVFNTDHNNPVLVNGNSVGILCINTIEGWKQCTIKIPGSALRVGSNTLTIQSKSRGGNYDDFMIRNIWVTPSSDAQPTTPTPTALSSVHHLGDQTLSDWEVPKSEGTEYTTTFSLTAVPASADLILDVFNTDHNNPVLVNGNSIGILCISTIKSWKQCTIKIPGSALRVGSNTLTIQSESRGGNYDDFIIRNIWVTPSSDAQPTTPTPTTECGTFWVGVQELWFDEHPESIIGKLQTFDFDNDGSEDRIVYTFEPEEVAEDLFLVRTIEFNKTDSELFEGKIVLKFENKGDKPIEYSHIEEIPKSFAESVDDLVFSIPPDEIIDPDPKVMWKGLRVGLGSMLAIFIADDYDDDLDSLTLYEWYAFILDGAVTECNKRSGTSRDYCLLLLAEEFKAAEPTYVCHEIENEDLKNLCLGRVTGDKKYCEKIKNEDLRKLCLGQEEEDEEEVTTTPSTAPTITIPPGVHHLGDQNFTDWEVQSPEGTEYTIPFSLATVPASADLTLNVFQTNYNNPVLVNGQGVGFLCIHTSESWVKCTISIPGSALQIGSNTLTIRAWRRGSNYDDFMIKP
uniref:Uncharacterized protein n=1 Tax=Candidatus Methanophaga sp. ANME-1 ERB7 TaxID=2759913 RepID=A0A7G9Z615_9EURY|nr:hypothetical protein EEOEGNLI_00036 [Methanosarcinales archaeon ANME-1 ERB7]